MILTSTYPQPGVYQYSYPTFVDKPQHICIHFITPDEQFAFVTYPNQKYLKLGQLIPLSWFDSVNMVKQTKESQLMRFLEEVIPGLMRRDSPLFFLTNSSSDEFDPYLAEALQVA